MNPLYPRELPELVARNWRNLTERERELLGQIFARARRRSYYTIAEMYRGYVPLDWRNLTDREWEVIRKIFARAQTRPRLWGLFNPAPHYRLVNPAPGSWLYGFFRFVCSQKTFKRVYEPIFADMWGEYYEALKSGDAWKARWINGLTPEQ